MSDETKAREFWHCDFCGRHFYTNSKNGYCQKCFESKLICFVEFTALEAAESNTRAYQMMYDSKVKELEAEREKSKKLLEALKRIRLAGHSDHVKMRILASDAIRDYEGSGDE